MEVRRREVRRVTGKAKCMERTQGRKELGQNVKMINITVARGQRERENLG